MLKCRVIPILVTDFRMKERFQKTSFVGEGDKKCRRAHLDQSHRGSEAWADLEVQGYHRSPASARRRSPHRRTATTKAVSVDNNSKL
ncbi:unnamed protein product [Leptosia nina]|uniref:Uncharacterized protein n=1 Tax=Leptosia nina TaxID=320188 RepID=A0AAV1JET3_9NEOP